MVAVDRDRVVVLPMKNRLRVLRAEANWSQLELAMRVGVSRQAINAIETGKYDPSLPLAMKIARVFDRRIEEVFELEEGD
jgi:putative transcriptional regulator